MTRASYNEWLLRVTELAKEHTSDPLKQSQFVIDAYKALVYRLLKEVDGT